ncbi:hypothetical protein HPB48_002148 [Haemaphysalis longicornis]|uniref:HAT C-terminal dimerisation domain-containing protein n=1 Tax=Haemaphysalis longicornis TaxID=44386 RepID=A0A9J6FGF8_HAELO|nr:hypothetical protein HPB48_002148 [Haemaphysalis longicornis]
MEGSYLPCRHYRTATHTVEEEWRMLPSCFSKDEKLSLEVKPPALFWADLHQMRTFADKQEFLNIVTLAQLILSLPHSNAATERIFAHGRREQLVDASALT